MEMPARKGARSMAEIPAEILSQLERGELETANLVEWLAIDQGKLACYLIQKESWPIPVHEVDETIKALSRPSVNTKNFALGSLLLKYSDKSPEVLKRALIHPADMVRNWACYAIALNPGLSFSEKLQTMLLLADDPHFGVREVAWMALRPYLASQLSEGLELLLPLVTRKESSIKRFASEISRPRGVWCEHIQALKENPGQAAPLLRPLMKDESKYVQDSVANWLNDASKTRPDWVKEFCQEWELPDAEASTKYILKRAKRSLK
jgi:3-methyladenine DNA glycosylase AlkC